jgi:hypothetical protein
MANTQRYQLKYEVSLIASIWLGNRTNFPECPKSDMLLKSLLKWENSVIQMQMWSKMWTWERVTKLIKGISKGLWSYWSCLFMSLKFLFHNFYFCNLCEIFVQSQCFGTNTSVWLKKIFLFWVCFRVSKNKTWI